MLDEVCISWVQAIPVQIIRPIWRRPASMIGTGGVLSISILSFSSWIFRNSSRNGSLQSDAMSEDVTI
ncbi:hypothetical protein SNOG_04500 [Parastagonospora nodorum SN15]|uniref:Uncharacterized protein n=1 Tax=Phaeosphaeria nodorum (strain SN15 / ATCC MYA-4574 / FGSC 10173) TaxID=321614 RepID=Q0UUR4_PHANO|nr:hypothetical protein SNOG_04500 [Parastagonospora nodorum SN15]EAT88260.1 hypothetical protein SNOG_04500 [Parastagonospora nodorum SN15]